jgi:hypothetical protein
LFIAELFCDLLDKLAASLDLAGGAHAALREND